MTKKKISKSDVLEFFSRSQLGSFVSNIEHSQLSEMGAILAEYHNTNQLNLLGLLSDLDWASLTSRDRIRWHQIFHEAIGRVQSDPVATLQFFHSMFDNLSQHELYHVSRGYRNWATSNICKRFTQHMLNQPSC